MSAAQPSGPIDLHRHASRRKPHRGAKPPLHVASQRHPVLTALANDMEMHFNAHNGRTLTNEETATVYMLAIDLVTHTLEGAEAQGIIDAGQREELGILLAGMRAAPEHV